MQSYFFTQSKVAINNGLVKKFKDTKRASAIYKKLKPMLKEKNKSWGEWTMEKMTLQEAFKIIDLKLENGNSLKNVLSIRMDIPQSIKKYQPSF